MCRCAMPLSTSTTNIRPNKLPGRVSLPDSSYYTFPEENHSKILQIAAKSDNPPPVSARHN
jgi:hypothetical protein